MPTALDIIDDNNALQVQISGLEAQIVPQAATVTSNQQGLPDLLISYTSAEAKISRGPGQYVSMDHTEAAALAAALAGLFPGA